MKIELICIYNVKNNLFENKYDSRMINVNYY